MVNKISKRRISSWISIGCFILVRSLDQSVLLVGQMRSAVFAPPGNTQMDICSLNTRPGRATIMSFWFFAVNRESFETSDQNDEKIWSEQQKIYFVLHVDVHHVGVHHVGVHHVHVQLSMMYMSTMSLSLSSQEDSQYNILDPWTPCFW